MEDILDLQEITRGYCGLTEIGGAHMLEGCIAVLWLHDHKNYVEMALLGDSSKKYKLKYPEEKKTQQLLNSWRDKKRAIEKGAECIGILLALKLTSYEVVEQAVAYEGVDYWIGTSNSGILFQRKARLELSGIFEGSSADQETRFNIKIRQTDQSDNSGLPAYVCITEFSKPVSKFMQK